MSLACREKLGRRGLGSCGRDGSKLFWDLRGVNVTLEYYGATLFRCLTQMLSIWLPPSQLRILIDTIKADDFFFQIYLLTSRSFVSKLEVAEPSPGKSSFTRPRQCLSKGYFAVWQILEANTGYFIPVKSRQERPETTGAATWMTSIHT